MKSCLYFILLFAFKWNAAASICILNQLDAFEPKQGMPSGRFKGKCLKTEQRRNFHVLSESEMTERGILWNSQKGPVIANISHNGQFALAKLSIADIESLTFQMERFDPKWIAAHTQLRFNLSQPVLLYDQIDPSVVLGKTQSIIFSVEAVPMRDGPNYDLVKGLKEYYALSYRITSVEQKFEDVVIKEKNTVNQFKLNLSAIESQSFFQQIVSEFYDPQHGSEFREMYNTVCRNCTNVLFEALDKFLNLKRGLTRRALTSLPIISVENLRMAGLLDSSNWRLPDFNDEKGMDSCRGAVQP